VVGGTWDRGRLGVTATDLSTSLEIGEG
jgi:hypothetical protein